LKKSITELIEKKNPLPPKKLEAIVKERKYNDKYSVKFLKVLKKNFKYVKVICNLKINKKIKANLKVDYIFCFRSHFILNKKTISRAKIHAINFHPGPPEYRGIGCVNFSLLNKEKKYGATVHLINEKK
jgi:methionyl-tRNA formyltransferase